MNSNTVDLHIPGGESMRLVARLATVGYIASAGSSMRADAPVKKV